MNIKHLILSVALGIGTLLHSSALAQTAIAPATTNRIAGWLEGKKLPKLEAQQAEAYAERYQRQLEALLGCYQASTERSFLREAMTKYPRDPRVALTAACADTIPRGGPEAARERRQRLDAFKQSAPNNALAYHLSARDHFQTGQPEIAEQEVLTGLGKPVHDYALDFIQNAEEAYRAAGYSEAEAIALAMGSLLMPHLAQIREVGTALVAQAQGYRQSGNTASADKMLHAAVKLGAQLDRTNSFTLLEILVGITIQQNALKQLDPAAPFGNSGRTVQTEMNRLAERRADIRAVAKDFNPLFERMSDGEIGKYFGEQKRLGEEAADRQALAK
jgi:hypothetical protein